LSEHVDATSEVSDTFVLAANPNVVPAQV